ncbi:DEAD/DEAH box helicase [Polycladidibacter hongkongensis]|uniref:DEAD/DEAH box helicase n=1 Tax=Polycladidibacter hongkongensis TaxID=1647556 RepID=UPI000831408C|nr:DEAD/DEAH box helicase [Pseudovibrio hongkongensis]
MSNFDTLGVTRIFQLALERMEYKEPTPIQSAAIPPILAGKDLLGLAQTGTGKTAAFAVPLLQRLHESRFRAAPRGVRALILSPTRELAEQTTKNVKAYCGRLKMYVGSAVGGVPIVTQQRALERGLDVLVATPGRLLDLHKRGKVHFDELEVFVLDEADQMLDMGFIAELEEIAYLLPKKRQTLLFSATMPSEIAKLAQRYLHKPERIDVTPPTATADKADQLIAHVESTQKLELLKSILAQEDCRKALIFTLTKRGAVWLGKELSALELPSAVLQGDMNQMARNTTLQAFTAGRVRYLVATDVAARGIDISDITHVINWDMPNVAENYVHRIGRTARAGASGTAISFCTPQERGMLQQIQSLIKQKIPEMEGFTFFPSDQEPKSIRKFNGQSKKAGASPKKKSTARPDAQAKQASKPKSKAKPFVRRQSEANKSSSAPSSGGTGGYLKRKPASSD